MANFVPICDALRFSVWYLPKTRHQIFLKSFFPRLLIYIWCVNVTQEITRSCQMLNAISHTRRQYTICIHICVSIKSWKSRILYNFDASNFGGKVCVWCPPIPRTWLGATKLYICIFFFQNVYMIHLSIWDSCG